MKVLAAFNIIQDETIPFEAFSNIENDLIDKFVYAKKKGFKDQNTIFDLFSKNMNIHISKLSTNHFFKDLWECHKYTLKIKPDLIHVHHLYTALIFLIISIIHRTKFVITLHNDFSCYSKKEKVILYLCFIFSNKIVFNSKNTKASIPNFFSFIKKNKMMKIYNGVNIELIKSKYHLKYMKPESVLTIGTVGRIVYQKNHLFLIKAFYNFLKKIKPIEAKLVIVGDGPLRKNIQKTVTDLKLSNNVEITGLISRMEVYKKLLSFNVCVFTSRYEGFCNAMVEAMTAGLPIIAHDIEPLPEVLGGHGLLYKKENINDLVEKIEYITLNRHFACKLGKNARNHAYQNYSIQKNCEAHANLYLKVFQNK